MADLQTLKNANDMMDKAVEMMRNKRNEEDRRFIVSQIGKDLVGILTPLLKEIADNSKLNREELKAVIREITVESPKVSIEAPKVSISVPEIKVPQADNKGVIQAIKEAFSKLKIPTPQVEVKVPEIKMPAMKDIVMPKKMQVEGEVGITADMDNPVPVMLVDRDGNPYKAIGGGGVVFSGGGGSSTQDVRIAAHSSVVVGNKTVSSAGTAVQLSSTSIPCKRVSIQAFDTNGDAVVVGNANVVGAASGRKGLALLPNQQQWFNINDVSLLWIDSVNSGDGVAFFTEE